MKGVASLTVAVAVSRGLISYDAKVADYWPEFAQAGKDAITVRQLLADQAGLSAIKPLLTLIDLAEATKMSTKLAAQAPASTPGDPARVSPLHAAWYEREVISPSRPEHFPPAADSREAVVTTTSSARARAARRGRRGPGNSTAAADGGIIS